MRFKHKTGLARQRGLSLVELLVYLGILGMLSVGVGFSIRYFLNHSVEASSNAQYGLEAEYINAALKRQMTGGSRVQAVSGYSMTNGNYCYEISENKPVSFSSVDVTNGAFFQYGMLAIANPLRTAEPKLASTADLGLPSGATAEATSRSLSMWVRLSNVDGNNRVLFDYRPSASNPPNSSYKMVVSVTGLNTVAVDMGMGLPAFNYSVSNSNTRNGDWHHLVVTAGDLSIGGSSPSLYLDGVRVNASNTGNATSDSLFSSDYLINIGSSANASWSLGPVGLWKRVLTAQEIAKLGRMEAVNVDGAFWLNEPRAALSTSPTNVMNSTTINARKQKGFLLFKKDREEASQTYFKIYTIENSISCPNPVANEDPVSYGFKLLTTSTCVSPAASQPILVGGNASGQDLGFRWRCNLSNGKQQAAATVVAGNTTSTVIKSADACSFPIEASDFDISKSSFFNGRYDSTNTAYVIVDDFDPAIDLIAFKGTDFPSAMPDADRVLSGAPAGTTASWFTNADNKVGMIRIRTDPDTTNHDTSWWVTNVFKNIKYKSRSDVYTADRKVVFALGGAWPIKSCPGLGYKSAYHFYKLENGANVRTTEAYRAAFQQTYFGMAGYVANIRCASEKDQISLRVLGAGNTPAVIGAWVTRQASGSSTSSPDFTLSREIRSSPTYGPVGPPTFTYTNEAWTLQNPTGLNVANDNNGSIQWRWIGGPSVDHNVIMLTDSTLCNAAQTVTENSKKGCKGLNTISVVASCDSFTNANSPACRIQQQSGGNQQYGWWQQVEPNESGTPIWMGYTGDNNWDDDGGNSARPYLLEFGDHPFDAISGQSRSRYQHALATSGDTSVNLDPPNMATKKVKSVNFQYCK